VRSSIKDLRFVLALTVAAAPVVGYALENNYHAFLVAFAIIPALDWLIGRSIAPSPAHELERLEGSSLFRGILLAYAPLHLGLIAWGAWVFGRGELVAAQALGLALSVGVVTGAQGITIAHELGNPLNAISGHGIRSAPRSIRPSSSSSSPKSCHRCRARKTSPKSRGRSQRTRSSSTCTTRSPLGTTGASLANSSSWLWLPSPLNTAIDLRHADSVEPFSSPRYASVRCCGPRAVRTVSTSE